MSFIIHPIQWWCCRELHQGCWGDAEGHPQHGHNSRTVSLSGSLLGWGNISIRRRSHLLDKITRSVVGFTSWGGVSVHQTPKLLMVHVMGGGGIELQNFKDFAHHPWWVFCRILVNVVSGSSGDHSPATRKRLHQGARGSSHWEKRGEGGTCHYGILGCSSNIMEFLNAPL